MIKQIKSIGLNMTFLESMFIALLLTIVMFSLFLFVLSIWTFVAIILSSNILIVVISSILGYLLLSFIIWVSLNLNPKPFN